MNFGNLLSSGKFNYYKMNILTNNVNVDNINIIFNFYDTIVDRFISFNDLKLYSKKIIYNFPNAKYIKIENTNIYGSIIAPNADIVINNGEFNGQLFAKSLVFTYVQLNEKVEFEGQIINDFGKYITISDILKSKNDKSNMNANNMDDISKSYTSEDTINIETTFDNIISQISLFTLGSQIISISSIPGRVAAESYINLNVKDIGKSIFNPEKSCNDIGEGFKYTVLSNAYISSGKRILIFNFNILKLIIIIIIIAIIKLIILILTNLKIINSFSN